MSKPEAKQAHKRKADCTPEEWAAHLAWHREYNLKHRGRILARLREKNSRPEVKARRKARDQTPHYRAMIYRLARKYRTGMSHEMVERLLDLQHRACAICRRPFSETLKYGADHCHDQKKPRGLLCRHCNTAEGHIRHSGINPSEFGRRLAEYLAKPPAITA